MTEKETDEASTPRWVKVVAIVALALAVLVVVMLVTGRGGGHGPGRHTAGDAAAHVTAGHTPPAPPGTRP